MFLLILKVATTLVAEIVLLSFSYLSFTYADDYFDQAESIDRSERGREIVKITGVVTFYIGVLSVFGAFALISYFWGIR